MHLFLAALAVLFVILGFAGFGLGGIPTIVFWILAALCVIGAWKMRSDRQRAREDRNLGRGAR
jgi:uncharacterized membrane protein YbaN (DUF454 family)